MRAALYLRVSTEDQTVENQRLVLERAAEFRAFTIVATYTDHAVSGFRGKDRRPALQRMLTAAKRHEFDIVMCWDLTRLSRSLLDLLNISQELKTAGVGLYVHQNNLDTTSPGGELVFHVLGAISQFERALLIERTKAGMARIRATGKPCGRAPIPEATRLGLYQALIADSRQPEIPLAKQFGVSKGMINKAKKEIASGEAARFMARQNAPNSTP